MFVLLIRFYNYGVHYELRLCTVATDQVTRLSNGIMYAVNYRPLLELHKRWTAPVVCQLALALACLNALRVPIDGHLYHACVRHCLGKRCGGAVGYGALVPPTVRVITRARRYCTSVRGGNCARRSLAVAAARRTAVGVGSPGEEEGRVVS